VTSLVVGHKVQGMSYAPVLAAAFVFWPVMGLLGAQGYGPLLAVAALPAFVLARPKMPPASYALMALGLVAWAAVTETWSPASRGLVSGNLLEGNFAIRASSVRIVLTALFGMVAVAGALRIDKGDAQLSSRVMLGAFAVQGLLVAASSFAGGPVVAMIYGSDPMEQAKGFQNIGRNANAFMLALPILAAYLAVRPAWRWKAVAGAMIAVSVLVVLREDAQSAVVGVLFMLLAWGVVWLAPRMGFRWLICLMAGYVAAAPVLMGAAINLLRSAGVLLPASFQSRMWSWEFVIGKAVEKPLFGHGIAASKTWRDTYADHPRWLAQLPEFWAAYPVVPGHPHNMALQIWAETGLVGAVLAGMTLVMIAFRLPMPQSLRPDVRYAIAGLVGVVASLFSFSYNVWNDSFWASVVLAVCAIILLSKRARASI
jgi:O-antigen ligase